MKYKLYIVLLIIVGIFTITACQNKEESLNNKKYKCEYTKKEDGLQTISKRIIEVNEDEKPVYYTYTYGYSNYGKKTNEYKSFCNSLKNAINGKEYVDNKDIVTAKVVCNKKNHYQAYLTLKYDVEKLLKSKKLPEIKKYIEYYTNKNKTFKKDEWKNTFYEDENIGKFECNY